MHSEATNTNTDTNTNKDDDDDADADADTDTETDAIKALRMHKLQQELIAVVYSRTRMELAIYQRGQRLNASVIYPAKCSAGEDKQKPPRPGGTQENNMPSAKVLNDIKLDRELDALIRIYEVADARLMNLEMNGSPANAHCELLAAIEGLKSDDNEQERSEQELRATKATLRALKARVASEREEAVQCMALQDERIAALRRDKQNAKRLNELELDLVQKWELNRYTQAEIIGMNAERALKQQIDELKRRIAGEERIIFEVQSFNGKQFEDLRSRIAHRQQKYANELALKEAETHEKERRSIELRKRHERHRETYKQRMQFVRDYLEEKAEMEHLLQLERQRVECAVRIQAWWRGVMVRRGLGPYKKKTKKGKKGKGKGK